MEGAIFTGLSALVGIFIGAYFSRLTTYSVWLRQRRSEIFAVFLQKIDEALHAAHSSFEGKHGQLTTAFITAPAFSTMLNYARIVQLHLKQADRSEFSKLANQIWAEYSRIGEDQGAIYKVNEKIDAIQSILEDNLELEPPALLRWLDYLTLRFSRAR